MKRSLKISFMIVKFLIELSYWILFGHCLLKNSKNDSFLMTDISCIPSSTLMCLSCWLCLVLCMQVLICRLIDRPLRPTIMKGFYHETQILSWVRQSISLKYLDFKILFGGIVTLFISIYLWNFQYFYNVDIF